MYDNGLFIFRRDLRVVDNITLNLANSLCKRIYAIFIFTPEQVTGTNKYKSFASVQFMIESLKDLSSSISKMGGKLMCFYGHNDTIIKQLIKELEIDVVCFNIDYSPYAIKRDKEIIDLCDKMGIAVEAEHDYYLHPPGTITNSTGKPYQKFTPFYNASTKKHVENPSGIKKIHFATANKRLAHIMSLDDALHRFTKVNENVIVNGGRSNAVKQMKIAAKNIAHYSKTRDELNKPTSQLSAFIKFGCISIREVYKTFKSNHAFIRQLYWRDFYANILYSFPHVLGHNFNSKYDKVKWESNARLFDAWKTGTTGIPIVDASQRQLLFEGWTHNRGRMISSSILTKIFLIDWRKGEQFYAQHLVDYDVANNNGGWQWSAGGGTDAQPWFRYFNPYLQSKEHDPECEYIKKWIPELESVPAKDIHNWETSHVNYKDIKYPKPIVNYAEQKEKSIKMYRNL